MGPNVLTSKSSRRDERDVVRAVWNNAPEPAFAMMVSMWVMPCLGRLATRDAAEVSEGLDSGRTISLLPSAAGSTLRSSVEVASERTVAMIVVFGRKRREEASPRPIPAQ